MLSNSQFTNVSSAKINMTPIDDVRDAELPCWDFFQTIAEQAAGKAAGS
jgi:hypothetical protein